MRTSKPKTGEWRERVMRKSNEQDSIGHVRRCTLTGAADDFLRPDFEDAGDFTREEL